ncbi:M28 family peptidase [Acidobacteriota bacterium]
MNLKRSILIVFFGLLVLAGGIACKSQEIGMNSIKAEDMEFHMKFLAADEFLGRNTPSRELKIASRYIALKAEDLGLKPLMPDGSYLQEIPLDVAAISEVGSFMSLKSRRGTQRFSFPQSFGTRSRSASPTHISGGVVFLGLGLESPEKGWDDYKGVNLKGKVAVILDVDLPEDHVLKPNENRRLFYNLSNTARRKGAAAVLTVISREREKRMIEKGLSFDNRARSRIQPDRKSSVSPGGSGPYRFEIRHDPAAAILGISKEELNGLFDLISSGKQVPSRRISGATLDVQVEVQNYPAVTHNVVGYIEGSDPELKDEFVLFGSHHDGIGSYGGRIFNGADDNISGVVAMFELAEALMIEKPKRSMIFVWHTGEEKGLWGASYFISHSPVPVDKMSAELNMDMLCRNDPNSIYLIGSNKLSSELDEVIHQVNDKHLQMTLDYTYDDPTHPDRFFFRSDQYPYIRYGIPGVWFFCGTTEDYHQENDDEDRVDYVKMEKVTRLVYLTAVEIGNRADILKLDLHPEITTRGEHNMKVAWR